MPLHGGVPVSFPEKRAAPPNMHRRGSPNKKGEQWGRETTFVGKWNPDAKQYTRLFPFHQRSELPNTS